MSEYLALDALSSGMCNDILRYSPRHARYWRDNHAADDTSASDLGTAFHDAFLEGLDRIEVIDAADWRTKAAKEARDAARVAGKIPMLQHKAKSVEGMVSACKEFVESGPLSGVFSRGLPELTMTWNEGDVLCKARPDFLTNERDVLVHLKSTAGSAKPEAWIRTQLEPMGYDVAAAFYSRGMDQFEDADSCEHVFFVIEQMAPYGCSLVSLSPAMWDIANGKVNRAIRTWRQCRASGKYPAYPTGITLAEPRAWQMEEAMENGDIESLSFEERIELGSQA